MQPDQFLMAGIGQSVKQFLTDTGRASGRYLHALQEFLADLAPQAEANAAAALAGDVTAQANLGYLADLAVVRSSRLADDFEAEEMARLAGIVRGVVNGFLAMGLNAVAPGLGTAVGTIVGAESGTGGAAALPANPDALALRPGAVPVDDAVPAPEPAPADSAAEGGVA